MENYNSKIPVTILTGFLGSGKTTLLNRILSENHGKKIAVIENEFGEIGVDNELVIGADEEIFEMNNGCICCTVRGDLIRILTQLTKRKDKLDMIIVETTGMANPAPVAQTFWVDSDLREQFSLDAIITLIDAKHVWNHIDESDECKEQIAFADIVLLNKTDLVSESELGELKTRIKSMNKLATIHQCENANIELDKILNIGAFDLDRKAEFNPSFLAEELPFEAIVKYELEKGIYQLILDKGPDPTFDLLVLKNSKNEEKLKSEATVKFSDNPLEINSFGNIESDRLVRLKVEDEKNIFFIELEHAEYSFFTQHGPDEFNLKLKLNDKLIEPIEIQEFDHSHTHDDEITSVGIVNNNPLNQDKFNTWISFILSTKGTDIFRSKGVLFFYGAPKRVVFQGVNMLFDANDDRFWEKNEEPKNQLIFIGKNLNREELTRGFENCLMNYN
jgi:G3E family GTPase